MSDLVTIILLVSGYIFVCFILIRLFKQWTRNLARNRRLLLFSIIYTCIYGIGILGGGGEPGFAFPAPLAIAAIIDIIAWVDWKYFINGVLIPFFFWWTLILVTMVLRDRIRRNKIERIEG